MQAHWLTFQGGSGFSKENCKKDTQYNKPIFGENNILYVKMHSNK